MIIDSTTNLFTGNNYIFNNYYKTYLPNNAVPNRFMFQIPLDRLDRYKNKMVFLPEFDQDTFTIDKFDFVSRPEKISQKVYNTPDLWWAIAMRNDITDPLKEFYFGRVLHIPNIQSIYMVTDSMRSLAVVGGIDVV